MRSEPERLHPAAWLVETLASLREALLPAVVAFLVNGASVNAAGLIGLLAVGASALLGWLRWSRTSFWIEDDALQYRSGILSPDQRAVPLARIAAVDEVQGPVQRLFGVTGLHVQTAGGGAKAEIVLRAVTRQRGVALREELAPDAARSAVSGQEAPDAPTWRLGTRDLLLAAVTGPQISVVLPAIAGVGGLLPQVLGDEDAEALLRRLPEGAGIWVALAVLAALVVLGLSLLGAVLAFGGFEIRREPQQLRLRRGFVQRRTATVGIERVHAVQVVEGLLRRPLGRCAVRLEVAGYAAEASAGRTLIPLCRRQDLPAILGRLLPELPIPADPPQRPPRRAARPYLLVPATAGAVVAAIAAGIALAAGAPAVTATAIAAGALAGAGFGLIRLRAAGWWLDAHVVALRRHGVLARSTTIAAPPRLQHVELRRSPPQRRAELATLEVAVASGHRSGAVHLDAAVATDLLDRLRAAAITRARTEPVGASPEPPDGTRVRRAE